VLSFPFGVSECLAEDDWCVLPMGNPLLPVGESIKSGSANPRMPSFFIHINSSMASDA